MSTIRTVAIYARLSKASATTESESLEHQQRRLEGLAASLGWEVVAVFVDDGRSAFKSMSTRRAFQDMLDAAERHEFDALLVTMRDRWARNVMDSMIAQARMDALGIAVLDQRTAHRPEEVSGRRITSTAWLQRQNEDTFAEFFARLTSEKISDAKRDQVRRGIHVGDVPFGYRRPDPKGGLVPDEAEAPLVRTLFERHATGAYSLADEARWLNAEGARPHSKRGREFFTKAGVRSILESPIYIGQIRHGDELLPGSHEPIVDEALFRAASAARPGHRAPRAQTVGAFYLSGIGVHSECGNAVWANGKRDGRSVYRCSARAQGRPDAQCTTATAPRVPVDAEVSRLFEQLVLPQDWRDRVDEARRKQAGEQADPDGERRAQLETRRANVQRAILDELVPYELAAKTIRDLDAQIAALTVRRLPRRVHLAGERLLSIHELWPRMTDEERQECVRLVLRRVEVDLARREIAAIAANAGECAECGLTWPCPPEEMLAALKAASSEGEE